MGELFFNVRKEPVRAESLTQYRRRGWTVLHDYLAIEDLGRLRRECDRLQEDRELFRVRGSIPESNPRNDRLDPVSDISPLFHQLAKECEPIAASFLDGKCRQIKDKLIYKPPGAAGYALHQDYAYYQEMGFKPDDACTVCVCIDGASIDNGAIQFARGADWALVTPAGSVCDPPENFFEDYDWGLAQEGDLIVFSTLAPHRSDTNSSDTERRMAYFLYGLA